jgi:hypothetical protein
VALGGESACGGLLLTFFGVVVARCASIFLGDGGVVLAAAAAELTS